MIGQSGIAIRNIVRADASSIDALAHHGVASIHEAMGRAGLLAPYLRPIYAGAKACGTAVTIFAQPGDNWMLHVAAEMLQPGDIAVVATASDNVDGMFGDMLATSYMARGATALIIDAACRDTAQLRDMRFPVWSKGINGRGCVKATLGSVNVPVICAGALVHPGDVIVADDDGVVVVPREKASEIAVAAANRERREAGNRKRLASGELGLDIYGMRNTLAQTGLMYFDDAASFERYSAK